MNYKSSTNFATTTFTFFSFCKNLRFFHVAKICVARVSLLPGRATQVGRGHVCTVLLLVSASAELAHAPHSNHRSTSKRYPPTEVSRNVPDETSTSAETGGVSAPEVSVPLVSASAESAHAPHSSPARTNEGQRARRHVPDEDCSGLTLSQAVTFLRFKGAQDEVPAFPNGKDKGTRQNSIRASLPFFCFA